MPIVRGVICDQCGTMMYWCGNVSKARAAAHARNDGWTIGKMFVSGLHKRNESRKREVKQKRRNQRERGKRTDGHRQDISLS